jgi:hypothetical protein
MVPFGSCGVVCAMFATEWHDEGTDGVTWALQAWQEATAQHWW